MLYWLSPQKQEVLKQYPFVRDFLEDDGETGPFEEGLREFREDLERKGLTQNELKILRVAGYLKDRSAKHRVWAVKSLGSYAIKKMDRSLIPLFLSTLNNNHKKVRHESMKALAFFARRDGLDVLRQYTSHGDPSVSELAKFALSMLSSELRDHQLYAGQDPAFFKKDFARRKFEKTGGETTLLGGKFTGKVVIKTVPRESFEAWKRAFLAEEFWKQRGYDYVPIEPILSKNGRLRAHPTKDGRMRVATAVLGNTFAAAMTDPLLKPYHDKMESIYMDVLTALPKLGVDHGHADERDVTVEVDRGKIRIYIIDWDDAKIFR